MTISVEPNCQAQPHDAAFHLADGAMRINIVQIVPLAGRIQVSQTLSFCPLSDHPKLKLFHIQSCIANQMTSMVSACQFPILRRIIVSLLKTDGWGLRKGQSGE